MINQKELQSLIVLLDDTDPEVLAHVEERILSMGEEAIPFLETEWQASFNSLLQQRIENVIHRIQFESVKKSLQQWSLMEEPDLLTGVGLIARYRYPDLDLEYIENEINKIKLDVWLEMHNVLSPLEKVRVMNHVMYNVHGFRGNTSNYHAPQNSFINNVLESHHGNHISLAIIYMLVAQSLNLPIYGVNFPQQFLLAYKEENESWHYETDSFNTHHHLDAQEGKVLFYINAFSNGVILTRKNLDQFVKQIHVEPKALFFEPCSNLEIIKRVLRNLFHAYDKADLSDKCDEVNEMVILLGEDALQRSLQNHDEEEHGEEGD